jgi:hypothetical protein
MRFSPMSEQELNHMGLIEKGVYNFEVINAKEAISKKGNEMIVLTLKIWDKDGKERILTDYILESFAFKLRHFCESTNLIDKYNAGELNYEDCISKSGKVEIIVQEGGAKPDGSKYFDRNSIKDYVKKENKLELANDFIDDDLPF